MEKDKKYAGWSNYETWLLNLNVGDEEYLYDVTRDFIRKRKNQDDYETAGELKDLLGELTYKEDCGVYKICDVWAQRNWDEIDWIELVKKWKEE